MENNIQANIYFKDGSKKSVTILGDILNSRQPIIEFISRSNLPFFLETQNPMYIESIDTLDVEGIDVDLK